MLDRLYLIFIDNFFIIFFMNFIKKYFQLNERNTSISKEIIGGLITFLTIIYILPTNASIMNSMGVDYNGAFALTALVSAAITLALGLISNYPIVISTGMGLNVFVANSLHATFGFSWQECMIISICAGIILLILTITKVREKILSNIPNELKTIITCVIGIFICSIGLYGSGIFDFTKGVPSFGNFNDIAIIVPLIGIFVGIFLIFTKIDILNKFAIPITLLITAILGISINYGVFGGSNSALPTISSDWGAKGIENVFLLGAFSGNNSFNLGDSLKNVFTSPQAYIGMFTIAFMIVFSSSGALISAANNAHLIDENGNPIRQKRVMYVESIGATCSGICSVTPTCMFAESNTGISFGARTGLSTSFVSLLLIISAFTFPIFSMFSSMSVTSPVLVVVGINILIGAFKNLDLKNARIAGILIISLLITLLTYSISFGLGSAIILYVVINLIRGEYKSNNIWLYVICVIFILSLTMDLILKY